MVFASRNNCFTKTLVMFSLTRKQGKSTFKPIRHYTSTILDFFIFYFQRQGATLSRQNREACRERAAGRYKGWKASAKGIKGRSTIENCDLLASGSTSSMLLQPRSYLGAPNRSDMGVSPSSGSCRNSETKEQGGCWWATEEARCI